MTYKPYDFSDDVCDDSCVEWFMDFLPGNTEGYMNLEATACAAINCCTGTGRNGRIPLNERFGMLPEITAGRSGEYWWVEYFVSLELIHRVYGDRQRRSIQRQLLQMRRTDSITSLLLMGLH